MHVVETGRRCWVLVVGAGRARGGDRMPGAGAGCWVPVLGVTAVSRATFARRNVRLSTDHCFSCFSMLHTHNSRAGYCLALGE